MDTGMRMRMRAHSSGVKSTMSFHKGFPRLLANMSQTALLMAAVARWMTPFSGPSQRCWGSPTTVLFSSPHMIISVA